MSNLILGVLGHIDHGKTSIIRALNGFWGDSTNEEQKRGITLDLSFSNLRLGDKNIAFIDVPGHEKLVKNMIAGSFGMDGALFVIAANEGIKPQSIEHLEIAKLLGIEDFLVALSKCDLVSEEELKNRIKEVEEFFLKIHPKARVHSIPVSIYDKNTIELLKIALSNFKPKARKDLGFVRYYIDRSFSIKGAGCVVSGTLLGGVIEEGQKLWSCELERLLGVKNIQRHGGSESSVCIGERVALNLGGVNASELQRGYLLTQKGFMRGFDCLDVSVELLEDIPHNSQVFFYIGAAVFNATILFLNPQKTFATLHLERHCFSIFGEPFILRNDMQTLGGGRVLNTIADPMKKSQKLAYLSFLEQGDFKGAFGILLQAHKKGFGIIGAMQRFALSHKEALDLAAQLEGVFVDDTELVIYPNASLNLVSNLIFTILEKNKNALLSPALLAQKYSWISIKLADHCLEELYKEKKLQKKESFFVGKDFGIENISEYVSSCIFDTLKSQGLSPLAPNNLYDLLDLDKQTGDKGLKQLLKLKKIVKINHKLYITQEALNEVLTLMRDIITKEGFLQIANFKKYLNLSRKYLIAYLEYLDNFKDIKTQKDIRSFV